MERLTAKYTLLEQEKKSLDARHVVLADHYETALKDLHVLNGKVEAAVDARQQIQQKYEQALAQHHVDLKVMEQSCAVQLECMEDRLARERMDREKEKCTLPENYRLIVEAARDRYEKMEAKCLEDKKELEDASQRERERWEKVGRTLRHIYIYIYHVYVPPSFYRHGVYCMEDHA